MQYDLQTIKFRDDGPAITRVGLGGEGVLRTHGYTQAAQAVIHEAIKQKISYFDSAKAYAGSEGYYGSVWSEYPLKRQHIFQTSKSACRNRRGALQELEDTLATMGISRLDLWQIHDIRTEADLQAISAPGGALDAFLEARDSGKTRFIGVTGHENPYILARAISDWPVDAVMMPVNPVEGVLGGFLDLTLPIAKEKGLAVIGMKTLGASHYILPDLGVRAEDLIRYALAQEITVAIVGCSSPDEVQILAQAGQVMSPMTRPQQIELEEAFRPYADGLAFYRKH